MKIVILANDRAFEELSVTTADIKWLRADNAEVFLENDDATGFFNLSEDASEVDYSTIQQPVFINSVTDTLNEKNAGKNIMRINGWRGFIRRNTWEAAGHLSAPHANILHALKKKHILLPDEPGFVSARIISMIINEAFYAKGEQVSTENEINIAMRLGTNYPLGPFEWAEDIGIKNIYRLLEKLNKSDSRYRPSPLLKEKANS